MAVLFALGGTVWADCQENYNEAMLLLNNAQQEAGASKHPDVTVFRQNFQKSVDKMKEERCTTEVVKLLEHIQSEQQKLPPAMPIED
jgi:hypothetical protein